MSDGFKAGVRLRRIGRELRKWRERAGLKNAEAAKRLKWSTSKVSKIENAAQPIQGVEVLAMGLTYEIGEEERNRLYRATLTAQDPGWWQEYDASVLFDAAQDFVELESEATVERTFMTSLVPGILQTEDYVAALSRSWIPAVPENTVRSRAEVRTARQSRLFANTPLSVEAVIWEPALRQRVGGGEVSRGQLTRLAELGERSNVSVQVLPAGGGAFPAMGSSFEMLSFAEQHWDDVVYLDNLAHGVYLEEPHDVEIYTINFTALKDTALSPEASLKLIGDIAGDMSR